MADKTLPELIDNCVALSRDGDFHLEHFHLDWRASTCWQEKPKWSQGATPEEAVANLLLMLQEGSHDCLNH